MRPKNYIKVQPHEPRTLSWWNSKRNKIDMAPPYQRRGGLWSDSDKAYLIDSILNGFDIPKVYMADFTLINSDLNTKELAYAIIDGKQRFEAIFGFFDGKVVLNDDFEFIEDPKKKIAGLGYKDIQKNFPEISEIFENYNLTVMAVYANEEAPINDLFVRLNRSKPLTGAEIRNAMLGPGPGLIRQIAKHTFLVDYINFVVKRGQDLNAAAKLLYFEYHGEPRETKKRNLDSFINEVEEENKDKLQVSFVNVVGNLDKMAEVFLPKDRLLSSSGLVPVYYWFVRDKSEEQLAKVRIFLQAFETKRKESRARSMEDPTSQSVNQDFVNYNGYNRSTNDQTSHIERVKILNKYFSQYLRTSMK